MRIFNKQHIPEKEVLKTLREARLTANGFKLEVSSQEKIISGRKQKIKTHFYYKIVPCDKAREVEKQLNDLLKGESYAFTVRVPS